MRSLDSEEAKVKLSHGSGGKETSLIVERLILSKLSGEELSLEGGVGLGELDDGAAIPLPDGKYLVLSIDSYTVNPPFFPGGDLGKLAACGTINDVLMMGGVPKVILDSIIVEEGSPISEVEMIANSLIETLRSEGVKLVGGDFKVMPRGQLDRYVITTAGLGIAKRPIVDSRVRAGDKVIVTGTIGEHGAAILAAQEGLSVKGELRSDVEPLTRLMVPLIEKYGESIHAAQDPTRGGLAQTLNEWAKKSGLLLVVSEERVPVREEVRAFTELLGIDPFFLACEGRAVLGVDGSLAEEILDFIRDLGYSDASIIGEVRENRDYGGIVIMRTLVGGLRILEPPSGVIVPRIC
ncbi:MAG: hydrogenase expression/formation protein HypE [Candidatus Korarchaeota archaeon NZ13-K]|nr:MAG: hydrogenase expression/formation protein HypE [Candidatus Korarchaeota archaeon NZ13-K]